MKINFETKCRLITVALFMLIVLSIINAGVNKKCNNIMSNIHEKNKRKLFEIKTSSGNRMYVVADSFQDIHTAYDVKEVKFMWDVVNLNNNISKKESQ